MANLGRGRYEFGHSAYYPEVTNYSSLPSASGHADHVYLVLNGSWSGIWHYRAGLYRSNGTTWTKMADLTTVSDEIFTLVDDGDNTKKAQFECGSIAAATTRTFTFPNASGTLALESFVSGAYVPYTGATGGVNLGAQTFTTTGTLGAGATTLSGNLDMGSNDIVSIDQLAISLASAKATLEFGTAIPVISSQNPLFCGYNIWYDGANWKRTVANDDAVMWTLGNDGAFKIWAQTDGTATVDSVITWNSRFILDKNGNLTIDGALDCNTISPAADLHLLPTGNQIGMVDETDPDVAVHLTGATHVSQQGLFKVEGNSAHAFMCLEASSGSAQGYILRNNGTSEGYMAYTVGSPGCFNFYDYSKAASIVYFYDDGKIRFPYVYNVNVGGTNHPLYIDDSGYIGKDPSSLKYKTNIRDIGDTSWIYDLQPKMYDRKDGTAFDEVGLIAEDVDLVYQKAVIYETQEVRDMVYEPSQDKEVDMVVGLESTEVPEGVAKERLIVPMLREIQKLNAKVNELTADVAELKAT